MAKFPAKMKQFCDEQQILRLACIDGQGYPHVIPVWYVRMGNDFIVGTDRNSTKWQLMKVNPKVGWVIDTGSDVSSYKGASFRGTVEEVTDKRTWNQAFRAIGTKYYGSPEDPDFLELFGGAGTVLFRLKPESSFFWDYSQ
jgi:nitroimidazol reductase NimA-like FMN-containing flavoprotein (pyridoxamine 5'-phosphate oxidase superfamily)